MLAFLLTCLIMKGNLAFACPELSTFGTGAGAILSKLPAAFILQVFFVCLYMYLIIFFLWLKIINKNN